MSSEDSGPFHPPPSPARSGGSLRQAGLFVAYAVKGFWGLLVARRPVRIAVGLLLLLLGLAGLFLPVLQGLATIIAALAILRQDIPLAERIWQRWVIPLEQRFQRWVQRRRQRRSRSL